MKIHMFAKIGLFAFGAAVLPMLTAGCSNKPKQAAHRPEPKMEPARAIDSMIETQAINGAHKDPTLSYGHFDGAELNALGRSKMQLILRGTAPGKPVLIYTDLGRSELAQARKSTIERYWKDSLMTQAHLELRDGTPDVSGPAREALTRLPLTNSTPKGANVTPAATPGMAPPGTGGTGSGPQETLFK